MKAEVYECIKGIVFDPGTDLEKHVRVGTIWIYHKKEGRRVTIKDFTENEYYGLYADEFDTHFKPAVISSRL